MSVLQETATEQAFTTRPMIDNDFEGKNIISIDQFTRGDVEYFLDVTADMEAARHAKAVPRLLGGKVLQAVMFEDSSRTSNAYLAAA